MQGGEAAEHPQQSMRDAGSAAAQPHGGSVGPRQLGCGSGCVEGVQVADSQGFAEARSGERPSQARQGPSYLVTSALAAPCFVSAESALFKHRSRNRCRFVHHTGLA